MSPTKDKFLNFKTFAIVRNEDAAVFQLLLLAAVRLPDLTEAHTATACDGEGVHCLNFAARDNVIIVVVLIYYLWCPMS